MAATSEQMSPDEFSRIYAAIRRELSRVVIGQTRAVDELLASVFAGGHSLLTGMPGLGRTLIVKSLATILGLEFRRVQFTPDLLPTDLLGMEVLEDDRTTGARRFRLHKGPVFTNLLLADEVNRSPNRTQTAMLEVMQERQVTLAGTSHPLPTPFILIATENSIETEGVWRLGEAQVDRFMVSILLDYPTEEQERQIMEATTGSESCAPAAVTDPKTVLAMQALASKVPVIPSARQFALALVRMSRTEESDGAAELAHQIRLGASPRAAQALLAGAKVLALSRGRRHVTRQDVADLAAPVMRHRVILDRRAKAHGTTFESILPVLMKGAWEKSRAKFGFWSRKLVVAAD